MQKDEAYTRYVRNLYDTQEAKREVRLFVLNLHIIIYIILNIEPCVKEYGTIDVIQWCIIPGVH